MRKLCATSKCSTIKEPELLYVSLDQLQAALEQETEAV
jgi:hypothetical protein